MLPPTKRATATLLMAFMAAPLGAMAQQAPALPPTIADIARQKRAEKAKKVYHTEDMKAAVAEAPPAEASGAAEAAPPERSVRANEALAAAQAKIDDLKDRESFYTRTISRFEKSATEAGEAGDTNKQRIMLESLESAKVEMAKVTADRTKADEELVKLKAAQAAAAAAAKKRPARRPTPKPKS